MSKQADKKEIKQKSLKEFYKKIFAMQEDEKKRISRDLHDESGQIVIALGASLNVLEKELKSGNIERALEIINENRAMIQDIANRMKSMALNLRPPALDILGLPAVLREYFSQCTKTIPVKIEFNENLKEAKLSENLEITLYRIIQEIVFNSLKHSSARQIKVNLIFSGKKIQLYIEDNGTGFDIQKYIKEFSSYKTGLRTIKERVQILNGTFFIKSNPGQGTRVDIVLPAGEEIDGYKRDAR